MRVCGYHCWFPGCWGHWRHSSFIAWEDGKRRLFEESGFETAAQAETDVGFAIAMSAETDVGTAIAMSAARWLYESNGQRMFAG